MYGLYPALHGLIGCIMCGIVGCLNLSADPNVPVDAVMKGLACMKLRGPDGEGLYKKEGILLGHRRLAIIDLAAGEQPFIDPETGAALVFNGEIYNFTELRDDLKALGRIFRTSSDTEVLLQSWLQWGEGALSRLRGMFAFAIYEPSTRRLVVARDHLGIKPLFYSIQNGRLMFASSMAALLAFDDIDRRINLSAVSHYLTTLRVRMDRDTLLGGVHSLLPGEYLSATFGASEIQINRYWDIPLLAPDEKEHPDMQDAMDRVRDLVRSSVQEQLVSDVPLGGFLSGGIDSSIIAGVATEMTQGHFDAYSVGYDVPGYNEWEFIQMAADHKQMGCKQIHLKPEEYSEVWEWLIGQNGLPLATPNEVPIYHLAKALRNDFTVALSGEGADEIFGGYVMPYFSAFDFDRARREAPGEGEELMGLDRAIRRLYGRPYFMCLADHYFLLNSWVPFQQKQRLFESGVWDALEGDERVCAYYEDTLDRYKQCSTFDAYMHLHARINLEGLLLREDSSTMAASVEARVPYTDHRIVDYLFSLPDHYKINWLNEEAEKKAALLNVKEIDRERLIESKVLLRHAFKSEVPEAIMKRKKMSFPVPVREWFASTLRQFAVETIKESSLGGSLFKTSSLNDLVASPELPQNGMALWPVVNLCLWARAWKVTV